MTIKTCAAFKRGSHRDYPLSDSQEEAKGCLNFLTKVDPGDYLLYLPPACTGAILYRTGYGLL